MIDKVLRRTGKSGVVEAYEPVPEYSAVGASPSNDRAKSAVQTIQDQLRTLKSALESRIDTRVPSDRPVMRWLVRHSANVLDLFKVHGDGNTAYQSLHGSKCSDKVVEPGDQVFFSSPKKLRSKLRLR